MKEIVIQRETFLIQCPGCGEPKMRGRIKTWVSGLIRIKCVCGYTMEISVNRG